MLVAATRTSLAENLFRQAQHTLRAAEEANAKFESLMERHSSGSPVANGSAPNSGPRDAQKSSSSPEWAARKQAAEASGGRWGAQCAVSLDFLTRFCVEYLDNPDKTYTVKRDSENRPSYRPGSYVTEISGVSGDNLTTTDVVELIIKPECKNAGQKRYAELPKHRPTEIWASGKPNFKFVSHAF